MGDLFTISSKLKFLRPLLISTCLVIVAGFCFATPTFAIGPCDDGTTSNDNIVCSADPVVPDDTIGLDLGDDTYTQNAGVTTEYVGGDSLADGNQASGNGGDDNITINGSVNTCVDGDNVDGDGGNDTIVINGAVHCVVTGDYVDGNGGDDTIIINGSVDHDVVGDDALGDGGDDTITINGSVGGGVYGDDSFGIGGNDTVILGAGADIAGDIDGQDGFDVLKFNFLLQSQLAGLDPSGGSLTINGHTYTWLNFEQLLGIIEELRYRTIFSRNGIVAVDALDGVKIFNANGLVAFLSFAALKDLNQGQQGLVFQSAAHSQGWYVVVTNIGQASETGNILYQVLVYDTNGALAEQFSFSN